MLNESEISFQVKPALELLLQPVPFINGIKFRREVVLDSGIRADFIANIGIKNGEFELVGEVRKNLQPRYVLDAIRQVKEHCSFFIGESAYAVVVSDYISPRSAEILINQNVSFFDLAGNCRLCFAHVYIEKQGEKSKSNEKRGIKSLFGLKSSRMLRLMLSHSMRPWQVKELAARAGLSLGQVSNVRRALLDQQYAIESEEGGVKLTQPGDLLNEWQKIYGKNIVKRESGFYSLLPSDEKQQAIKVAIEEAEQNGAAVILSSLSSAHWLAPYAKSSTESFYADRKGIEILKKYLMLEPVKIGPNVVIEEPKDSFVFKEAVECAPGLKCSSAIQTYLDLYIAGEREREAAEHIKLQVLRDRWGNNFKVEI